MLPSEIPKLPTHPLVKENLFFKTLLLFGNLSFKTPSLVRFSIPNSFVSLFIFYILSYLISKRMGCLSGCLVSSASIQKSFCRICSALKWPLDEFVGEKVVSLSSPFTILGPPPCCHIFITSLQFLSDLNIRAGEVFWGWRAAVKNYLYSTETLICEPPAVALEATPYGTWFLLSHDRKLHQNFITLS